MVSDEDPKDLIMNLLNRDKTKWFTTAEIIEQTGISRGEHLNAMNQLRLRKMIVREEYEGRKVHHRAR